MYKCVIFDLDGTLLNTLTDLANAGNNMLSDFNFPVWDENDYKHFVGNGIPKLVERILPMGADDKLQKAALELFCSYYRKHMNDYTVPYDGVLTMLERFKENGIKISVVTNKSNEFAPEVVKNHFGSLVDNVYGRIDGFPKKPDPYWVEKAISDYGFDKKDVFYVGDSGVDMQTAANAGIKSCGVLWGFRERDELIENGADYICDNCLQLTELVLATTEM